MGAIQPGPVPEITQAQARAKEASGLTKVILFGVLYLAGMAVSWAIGLYVLGSVFTSLRTVIPAGGPVANSTISPPINGTSSRAFEYLGPLFRNVYLFLPITVVIQLAAIAILTLGFRDLGKVDRSRFSTPSTLMLIMVAGTFLAAAGALLLFNVLSGFASVPPPMVQPAGALAAVGSIFLDSIVALVGGILTLVGLVGGLMLGLWRVGSRYEETLLKVAAIFVIIPFLNFVSPILVIVGAHGARARLSQAP